MNRLGRRSVMNGTGRMFGHNHQGEFRTMHEDPATGERESAWQIMVENTVRAGSSSSSTCSGRPTAEPIRWNC